MISLVYEYLNVRLYYMHNLYARCEYQIWLGSNARLRIRACHGTVLYKGKPKEHKNEAVRPRGQRCAVHRTVPLVHCTFLRTVTINAS